MKNVSLCLCIFLELLREIKVLATAFEVVNEFGGKLVFFEKENTLKRLAVEIRVCSLVCSTKSTKAKRQCIRPMFERSWVQTLLDPK